jgi:hypothetical protein
MSALSRRVKLGLSCRVRDPVGIGGDLDRLCENEWAGRQAREIPHPIQSAAYRPCSVRHKRLGAVSESTVTRGQDDTIHDADA